ncbi:MAG: ABC transporter permease [Candidatus Aminicenantes bacterium]|nr:ABC transporter permease [Candidatus Aminicenantes bacterium]
MRLSRFPSPPRLAVWLVKHLERYQTEHAINDDMNEVFTSIYRERGYRTACHWYWGQCLDALLKNIIFNLKWSFIMLKNYLKIAWRNLKRYKGYSFINIAGLAVGMAVFILIMIFVQYELSFDRYHKNADRIYRIAWKAETLPNPIAGAPLPLAPAMMEEYPEVISAARIFRWGRGEKLFLCGETNIHENLYYADPETFDVFSIPFIKGDPKTALNDPFSIILSKRIAEKYFGKEDPLGKVLTLKESSDWDQKENNDYVITGIFEEMPQNSHFVMDLIVPFNSLILSKRLGSSWEGGNNAVTYLLLDKKADPRDLDRKLFSILKKYRYTNAETAGDFKEKYFLQPLTSIHLDNYVTSHIASHYDVKYIYLYSAVAFLVLIIACINYINLTTARSIKRGKEVGIRKVVGARKTQLVKQFLSESFILVVVSLVVSLIAARLLLPYFNSITGRPLSFNPVENIHLFLGLIAVLFFVGFFSGSYPAFYISSIRPVSILSGKSLYNFKRFSLRNILVIAQFSITAILIISTLVVKNQLHFIQNKNMGFSKEQIIVSKIEENMKIRNNIEAVKETLKKNPNILAVCCSASLPNDIRWKPDLGGLPAKNPGEFVPVFVDIVDYDFVDVFEVEIIEGRNFSRDFPAEAEGAVLINESAAKACQWDSPIGKVFKIPGWDRRTVKITGIIKDFHAHSLHQPISPLFLGLSSTWKVYLSIKIDTVNIHETIDYIKNTLKEFTPNYPYEFQFFDEIFEKAYRTEQEMGNILSVFAFLSIFIGCLGLFGLMSFATEQRTKEIGIRKVLGASVKSIMSLLLKDTAKWVLIANVITWPLVYYLMHKWLQNFAYHISIHCWLFFLAIAITFGISVLTISYKVIQAASSNPVDSLRYE